MNRVQEWAADSMQAQVRADVQRALAEDLGGGDLTAGLISEERMARARVLTRERAVLCGKPWVEEVMRAVDARIEITWLVGEGEACKPDQVVLELTGPARSLLTAERNALNFLQMLSAVATQTSSFVQAVRGTRASIVDTRKTLPGLRMAQKYAVRVGGGVNHRIGLFDAVLIKENHIAAAGGIAAVMALARTVAAKASFVEIEVETLAELREALQHGAEMVLLDNMDLPTLQEAVAINAAICQQMGRPAAILEISGGVTLAGVHALAQTGVDRISIGSITKDVKAIDFSMRFEDLA